MSELRPTAPLPDAPRKLLYVDDDEGNRTVLKLRLRQSYDVILAETAEEACRRLVDIGHKLYVILLDIQLQGSSLDGIQIAKLIRGKLPESEIPNYARGVPVLATPIIFMTAYGAHYSQHELKSAGGDMVISKPVDFVCLCGTLARYHARQVAGSATKNADAAMLR